MKQKKELMSSKAGYLNKVSGEKKNKEEWGKLTGTLEECKWTIKGVQNLM